MADVFGAVGSFGEGHKLYLPGRGTTYYEIIEGADKVPNILLHGWIASTLNYLDAVPACQDMRSLAFDMRGHRFGIKGEEFKYSRDNPYLEANADDVAAAMDVLGIEKAVIVGYSMGTAIGLNFARRHPDRLAGLVLCAGGPQFDGLGKFHGALATANRALSSIPWGLRRTTLIGADLGLYRRIPFLDSVARNDPLALVQAGLALHNYDATEWLADIRVPVTVLLTMKDTLVKAPEQWRSVEGIPNAKVTYVTSEAGHLVGIKGDEFAIPLREALLDVRARAGISVPKAAKTLD